MLKYPRKFFCFKCGLHPSTAKDCIFCDNLNLLASIVYDHKTALDKAVERWTEYDYSNIDIKALIDRCAIKILITGSRKRMRTTVDWSKQTLDLIFEILELHKKENKNYLKIIVGDCPTGVDVLVKRFCQANAIQHRVYVADWQRFGSKAGLIRNQAMVDTEPTLCLGFPYGTSAGTRHCMDRARNADIPTIDMTVGVTQWWRPPKLDLAILACDALSIDERKEYIRRNRKYIHLI